MIERATIEAIRERVDLVEIVSAVVTLRRKGGSLMGLCPFHDEKSASFSVVPHKGIYHCFGCGEGGDVFKFLEKTRGLSFIEAVRELSGISGIPIEERELSPEQRRRLRARAELTEICGLAAERFHSLLMTHPDGRHAREYLAARGLDDETIRRFRIGYAQDRWDGVLTHLHTEGIDARQAREAGLAKEGRSGSYDLFRDRIVVPIMDTRERVIAFGGRTIPGTEAEGRAPKYVNSPETPIYKKKRVLFGLPQARVAAQKRKHLLVVEGYFDVLALHQAGFEQSVAVCGTALTADHVRSIRRLVQQVVALFDSDESGLRAAADALGVFVDAGVEARRLDLGDAKDPDEFIQANGAEAFAALLERGEPLFELVLRRAVRANRGGVQGPEATVAELAPLVRRYPPTTRVKVIQRISQVLGMPDEVIATRVGTAPRPAQGPVAVPLRWKGSKELNHLLWLLIHHPEQVTPVLAEVPPTLISEREPVLRAIGLLMSGAALPAVLDGVGDPDLAALLRAITAKSGLYTAEQAASAARRILSSFRIQRIRDELGTIDMELSACAAGGDMSRYVGLVRRRQELQKEKRLLESRASA